MDIVLFRALGIVEETKGFYDLTHQPSWFWGKSFVHSASFFVHVLSPEKDALYPSNIQYTRPWTQVYRKNNASFKGLLIT